MKAWAKPNELPEFPKMGPPLVYLNMYMGRCRVWFSPAVVCVHLLDNLLDTDHCLAARAGRDHQQAGSAAQAPLLCRVAANSPGGLAESVGHWEGEMVAGATRQAQMVHGSTPQCQRPATAFPCDGAGQPEMWQKKGAEAEILGPPVPPLWCQMCIRAPDGLGGCVRACCSRFGLPKSQAGICDLPKIDCDHCGRSSGGQLSKQ